MLDWQIIRCLKLNIVAHKAGVSHFRELQQSFKPSKVVV